MNRLAVLYILAAFMIISCDNEKAPWLSSLHAGRDFPLYTTYAAAQERSDYILDQGYVFKYDEQESGADFTTDTGGDICFGFKKNGQWVYKVADMYSPPIITSSYPDLVTYKFEPFKGIKVSAIFFTYSSRSAMIDIAIENENNEKEEIEIFPFMRSNKQRFHTLEIDKEKKWLAFSHEEYPDGWTRAHDLPYSDSLRNILIFSDQAADIHSFTSEWDKLPIVKEQDHSVKSSKATSNNFRHFISHGASSGNKTENIRIITYQFKLSLKPGESKKLRLLRSVFPINEDQDRNIAKLQKLMDIEVQPFIERNINLLKKVKSVDFVNKKQKALYWSNVNMMRQQFFPPQAKSDYNYYVFSREPTWGWGHGGQVFHESIVMLAYANVDPEGAMNSQRVYRQRQYPSGYINYRTGSYLNEIIKHNEELTSSAPWYSWLNWEVYKITKDKNFLKEMYQSSVRFYKFYVSNRDKDDDGLCEWGGHAVLESVRDALVAVWDEVGWPSNFEALGLNCMLVMEAKALEKMALELDLLKDADKWKADHEKRAELINKYCWDEETSFYYNVNKDDHSFTYTDHDDLKRMEIVGFLPLWAGIASEDQAEELVKHLTNPEKFWRQYGVPSLAADDDYYNDKGYWNGPVWVQWNYLIMRGLKDYGFHNEAYNLVEKVTNVMYDRLSKDHNVWEFYSPDDSWGGHHKTYIWAGIVNRMIADTED